LFGLDVQQMIKTRVNGNGRRSSTVETDEIRCALPPEAADKLIRLSRNSDVTLYVVLLSAFMVFLYRYTGRTDVYLGSPVYKENPDENLLNDFVVLRMVINEDMSFKDVLVSMKDKFIKACENQDYPFDKIIEELGFINEKSYDLIFDLIFACENIHDLGESLNNKTNNLLVSFALEETRIRFVFRFNTLYYASEEINNIIKYFNRITGAVLDNLPGKISEPDILSKEEKNELLLDFNNTKAEYPSYKTIHELFEEQVEKSPDMSAVVYENKRLTYNELNKAANRLAGVLRTRGITSGSIVGIMMQRSLEMIVGVLGIIKAGGAYLPIDPEFPRKRMIAVLEDSQAQILLTRLELVEPHPFTALQSLGSARMKPHSTALRPQINDFDSLPIIDRSLVDYEKYNRLIGLTSMKSRITMQATRGCPYDCSYCHKIWSKKHVARSAENLFKEIEIYYHMGIRRFGFIDDIFNLDRKNSERFFQLVIDNAPGVQLLFPAGLRGDILTKDYIDLMVKAGTVNITMSLETASPRLQKMIKKNLNIEKLLENLQYIIKKYPHIILELFTMHGFPTETREEAMKTMAFIKELKWLHFPYVNILRIYPKTDMEKLALSCGISSEAIIRSMELAFHELPETLPFEKSFTLQYQSEFLNDYFLNKERLLSVLPYQMKLLTEEEMVQKYNSYMPVHCKCLDDLLKFVGITRDDLEVKNCIDEGSIAVPGLNKKLRDYFPAKPIDESGKGLKVLLLDLSLFFTSETDIHYNPVEPPLGLLYLLTCLDKEFGTAVNGKIIKSKIDFDSYDELKQLLEEFKPDVIGVRSLTFYSNFYHRTIAVIRNWGIDVPIIAGGPYATSKYREMLQDRNIDLAVLGEGEITFLELIKRVMDNGGKLPDESILKEVRGIAFIPGKRAAYSPFAGGRQLFLVDQLQGTLNLQPCGNPKNVNKSCDPAYVMFTSGSTGKPKGIIVEHRSVNNLVLGLKERVYKQYDGQLNVGLVAPYMFDASVQQIFGTLLQGHCLYIVPEDKRGNSAGLIEFYRKNGIDISDGTPIHIHLLRQSLREGKPVPPVKHFIIGGEMLPKIAVEDFLVGFEVDTPIITNVYGPTECCVDSTSFDISKKNVNLMESIPIGKPMPNEQIYILNKKNDVQPIGVVGELCISGSGVSRGYLNRVELTAEKFSPNPFKEKERLFWTGDLARWLPDGNIECLGRIDHQVKIRGYRIELGEIESRLLTHPDVKEAVVIPAGGGDDEKNSCLCAYLVPAGEVETCKLREYLAEELPVYMIPAYLVILDEMPLNRSGKINRAALPEPQAGANRKEYEAPGNEIEEKLADIWQEVLGMEKIGIDDNFFELGGDSIKSIQISARLQEHRLKMKISDLFSNPTIKQLSKYVRRADTLADQGKVEGRVELTPIQRYFFDGNFTDRHHFNHSLMLYKKDGFDEEIIANVFTKLVEHHDALRMVYQVEEDGVVQVNRGTEGKLFDLEVIDFRGAEEIEAKIEREAGRIQRGIDLQEGPLVKLGLLKTKQGDHLLIVIHHLVVDGVSWRILLEDLAAGYTQLETGEEIRFPEKTVSFKYWAEKLKEYSESREALKETDYWRVIEETAISPLPGDFEVGKQKKKLKYCDTVNFDLNEADTLALLKDVNQAYNTEINDILLTALGMAVNEWRGVEKVSINLEGHGREEIIEGININRTVGWYTSQFPVILDMSQPGHLSYQIKTVKETLRRIPKKGIGYGILKYLTPPEKEGGLKFRLEPEISFNYLGQFGQGSNDSDSIIRMSEMNDGDRTSPELEQMHALNVNGILVGRKLKFSFSYNMHEYKKASIRELADRCKANLLKIIRHCANKKETESTPSDLIVDGVDLSLEDLDDIKELVELNIEE
jgi:amino acid adenylation domain-containing protein/non-ribosomal peptide synthase protein (TIGR01720 family)